LINIVLFFCLIFSANLVIAQSSGLSKKYPEQQKLQNAAGFFSITGQWLINQHNGFKGTLNLHQDQSGRLTGTATWDRHQSGTINGKIIGNAIEFTISYPSGIKGFYKGTLTQNGTKIVNGTVIGNNGASATWDATR